MDVIKTRQQLGLDRPAAHRAPISADHRAVLTGEASHSVSTMRLCIQILRESGPSALFVGLAPRLIKVRLDPS